MTVRKERQAENSKRIKEGQKVIAEHRAGLESIVREAIQSSGLMPNTLALKSGVSRQQVYRFLSGERGLTLDSLDKLCWVLNLTLGPKSEEKTGTND